MELLMTLLRAIANSLGGLFIALLAACASEHTRHKPAEQPLAPVSADPDAAFSHPHERPYQAAQQTLADFSMLDSVLAAVKSGDDNTPAQFLARQSSSAMGESVRNE